MKVYVYEAEMGGEVRLKSFKANFNLCSFLGELDLPITGRPIFEPKKTVTKEMCGVRSTYSPFEVRTADPISDNAKNIKITYEVEE
jgi:hypothetical protein